MIIDGHIHLTAIDDRYDEAEVQRCLALMDRAGIDRAVYLFSLFGGRVNPTPDEVRSSNDIGMELVARHPDRFYAYCYLNPAHPWDVSRAEIERCIVDGPMCGIKLWVSAHADDPRLDPIMGMAAELGVPVLIHAWYKATGYVFNESTPAEIATLAKRHPATTIIMAHLPGVGARGVLDIVDCPNVVIDTSGGAAMAGQVAFAVEQLGPDRVIFGSDWPIRDFAVQRARVEAAEIEEETRRKVMGGTMQRILDGRR